MSVKTVSSKQFKQIEKIVSICDSRKSKGISMFDLDGTVSGHKTGAHWINVSHALMHQLKFGKTLEWNTRCIYSRYKKGLIKEYKAIGR